MPVSSWTPILSTPMALGESPVWDADCGRLFWIDIAGHAVHCYSPTSERHAMWGVPSEPGCIALIDAQRLLVALRGAIAILDITTGTLTPYLETPYSPNEIRFNDGRCDAMGRLWVGSLLDSRARPGATLYRLERGSINDMQHPVTVSNGVAFSPDFSTLYHSDTTAHRINAFAFDCTTGAVGNSRVLRQFDMDKTSPDYGGRPDGAAVDSEGAYWCAMFEGGCLLRIAPTGEILQRVEIPARCPTMLAFGGPDLRTLYVTTARHNRPAAELEAYPLSGHVLQMQCEVAGLPEYRYVC